MLKLRCARPPSGPELPALVCEYPQYDLVLAARVENAADPERKVCAPDAAPQTVRHGFQKLVAHIVAVGVVDRLELVQIEIKQRECPFILPLPKKIQEGLRFLA